MVILLSILSNKADIHKTSESTPIQAVTKSQKNELNIKFKKDFFIIKKDIVKYQFEIDKTVSESNKIIKYYSEKDLYLLSQVIYSEAGSDWISDEIQLMVGSVVLNRVNSPYFPDNIYDVIHQKGQYQFILQDIDVVPNQRAIDNAKQLLDNQNDLICPSNILFQSESAMGDGIYKKYETKYATLYFCYKD